MVVVMVVAMGVVMVGDGSDDGDGVASGGVAH